VQASDPRSSCRDGNGCALHQWSVEWNVRELVVAARTAVGGAGGDGFESVDQAQQVGGLGLAELAGLEGQEQESRGLDIVRPEKQFDQPRLIELPLLVILGALAVEEQRWNLLGRRPARRVGIPPIGIVGPVGDKYRSPIVRVKVTRKDP
jgi:hypothetical protein